MGADNKNMIKNALQNIGRSARFFAKKFSDHDVLEEILDFGFISAQSFEKSRK